MFTCLTVSTEFTSVKTVQQSFDEMLDPNVKLQGQLGHKHRPTLPKLVNTSALNMRLVSYSIPFALIRLTHPAPSAQQDALPHLCLYFYYQNAL